MKRIVIKMVSGSFLLLALCCASSCQKQIRQNITLAGPVFDLNLNFNAVVDAVPLEYGKTYYNLFLEPYSVKTFKYYISDLELLNNDSDKVYKVAVDNYFLIDESAAATSTIAVKAPSNKYDHIAFTIGVDSIRNVSGAQTGALDPGNGMFWTWNSGYIMAKLEGNSPLSTEVDNRIQYHIGGFKAADNVLKKIVLPFPANTSLDFAPNASATITITANVNAWFNNPNDLHIAQVPVSMTPGDLSQKIAANYSKMFSLVNIVNN
jgi:hypothetical protein